MKSSKKNVILAAGAGIIAGAVGTLFAASNKFDEMQDDIDNTNAQNDNMKNQINDLQEKNLKFEKEFQKYEAEIIKTNQRLSYLEKQNKLKIECDKFFEKFISHFHDDIVSSIKRGATKLNYGNIINFIEKTPEMSKDFKSTDIDIARETRNRVSHPKLGDKVPEENLISSIVIFEKYNLKLDNLNRK